MGKKITRGHSALSKHKMIGNELTSSFMQLPNLKPTSWFDERYPDLIWVSLTCSNFGIEESAVIYKKIIDFIIEKNFSKSMKDIGLTNFLDLKPEDRITLIEYICIEMELTHVLEPLLLFESLPCLSDWKRFINIAGKDLSLLWGSFIEGTINYVNHQSDFSTFCRWARVYYSVRINEMKMPTASINEILNYPDVEDLRSTRPSIRSSEITLSIIKSFNNLSNWNENFWKESFNNTNCIIPHRSRAKEYSFDLENGIIVLNKIEKLNQSKMTAVRLDSKFDGMFGIIVYSLKMFLDVIKADLTCNAIGYSMIRTLTELLITMCYINTIKDINIWDQYRQYGQGQAKLILLKNEDDISPNINQDEYIELIAQEDKWMEFTPIKIGQWANTNLRNMSIKANLKGIYDKYYDNSSSYVHGNWFAVRSSAYKTCLNPLHRFHRIVDTNPKNLPNITLDAIELINLMLTELEKDYGDFSLKL